MIRTMILVLAICGVAGCATYKVPVSQSPSPLLNLSDGSSKIVIIRQKKHNGNVYGSAISVDGDWKAVLSSGTYVVLDLPPGPHSISTRRIDGSHWRGVDEEGTVYTGSSRIYPFVGKEFVLLQRRMYADHYFYKGLDNEVVVVPSGDALFLLFDEGQFGSNPIILSSISEAEALPLLEAYGQSADIRLEDEEWFGPDE